ncbi:hypothetical protein HPP92_020196 [Vanilla planifolia]|uniref:Uncharacterized protein n=1 Tax=Vanilla planifolia TaxID=51239 RepID=A0A835QE02_VANPL|nr:hypothetical protein HPP92_020196 [Vanilla planifolia]
MVFSAQHLSPRSPRDTTTINLFGTKEFRQKSPYWCGEYSTTHYHYHTEYSLLASLSLQSAPLVLRLIPWSTSSGIVRSPNLHGLSLNVASTLTLSGHLFPGFSVGGPTNQLSTP